MKKFLILLVGLSWSFVAAADNDVNYKIELNWADSETLSAVVVQLCDDTYYPGLDVKIPGKAGRDFTVEFSDVDITGGVLFPGCTVKKKLSRGFVTYTFEALSECTIKVRQVKAKVGEKLKVATYTLHEAC